MTRFKHLLPLTVLSLGAAITTQAASFKVVGNSSISVAEVSSDDLKAVFLGTKTSLGDGHVAPVLEKSGPAHEAFLKECVGKSDSALTNYYRSLVFTGKGSMPKTLASDQEVVDYVAKTKGAIGYIGAATAAAGVKTIAVN
jgi:ABC-type phosphate transport system substrate-binding protein